MSITKNWNHSVPSAVRPLDFRDHIAVMRPSTYPIRINHIPVGEGNHRPHIDPVASWRIEKQLECPMFLDPDLTNAKFRQFELRYRLEPISLRFDWRRSNCSNRGSRQ